MAQRYTFAPFRVPGAIGLGADLELAGIPKELAPGRYEVGITIKGITGDATDDPPDLIPFLWNWDKGPFGSGKLNLERALQSQGIRAVAVSAGRGEWKNRRRSGTFDFFGLSPNLWDASFTVTLDILGPMAPTGGLGALPVIAYVAASAAILAITHAIVKTLGGGDVVIDFLRLVGKAAGEVAKAVIEPAIDVITSPLKSTGGLLLLGVGVLAIVVWAKFSPKGRLAKKAVWG